MKRLILVCCCLLALVVACGDDGFGPVSLGTYSLSLLDGGPLPATYPCQPDAQMIAGMLRLENAGRFLMGATYDFPGNPTFASPGTFRQQGRRLSFEWDDGGTFSGTISADRTQIEVEYCGTTLLYDRSTG